MSKKISIIAVLIAMFSVNVAAHSGATGIVKDRMDRFGESRNNMKAIYGLLKAEKLDEIVVHVDAIHQWSLEMADYFPEGSNAAPSEALDMIWQKPEAFSAAIADHQQAASMLKDAALAGDMSAANAAFKTLGGTCSSCHRQFKK